MKYKIIMITKTVLLVVLAALFLFSSLKNRSKNTESQKENVEAQPLVIETKEGILPGSYETVIILSGEGMVTKEYEGISNIRLDGDVLYVICDDEIREEYLEENEQ